MNTSKWDVVVIGAGPAGLAAAISAHAMGSRVCVIEREARAGGILKQCIHDGFGLVRYREKLTGPEYALRDVKEIRARQVPVFTDTFLLDLSRSGDGFSLILQNSRGVFAVWAKALVAATGCRERTARQIFLHGERPAGVYTAGTVQRMLNIEGWLPGKSCVILGSGDIGLIMARRLTLEGAEVKGVYEIRQEPSGLTRNIIQCLEDYNIPLQLASTVTRVYGRERVEGVAVARVDKNLRPQPQTEEFVPCDTLVLSVGLLPENDILEPLGVVLDKKTGGPVVDQLLATSVPGIFSCGNALHVNDLVDYVSESGEVAGAAAAAFDPGEHKGQTIPVTTGGDILYVVPQLLNLQARGRAVMYLRSSRVVRQAVLEVHAGGEVVLVKRYPVVRPPEMERVELDLAQIPVDCDQVQFILRGD